MTCQICGASHSSRMHWRADDTKASHARKRLVRDKVLVSHGFFYRVVDVQVHNGRLWDEIEILEPSDEVPVQ